MHGKMPIINIAKAARDLGLQHYINPVDTVVDFTEALVNLNMAKR